MTTKRALPNSIPERTYNSDKDGRKDKLDLSSLTAKDDITDPPAIQLENARENPRKCQIHRIFGFVSYYRNNIPRLSKN